MAIDRITVRGARQHNLKDINVDIPRERFTVITGLSGSGKSSLAFDTIYAEGQRRYVESLSAYARQFLDQLEKPDVDSVERLSPAISIEQKTVSRSPQINGRYSHRNLRLHASAFFFGRHSSLPPVRSSNYRPKRRPDSAERSKFARRRKSNGARANRPRSERASSKRNSKSWRKMVFYGHESTMSFCR